MGLVALVLMSVLCGLTSKMLHIRVGVNSEREENQ